MVSIYSFSKEKQAEFEAAGIDHDLSSCLENNSQSFDITDIEKVLAVFEGERDERDWRWVIKVTKQCAEKNGGRFVFLQGGCDYTGWDCRSSADSKFAKTAKQAAEFAKSDMRYEKDEDGKVYQSLVEQLKSSKSKTWRESKDEELGVKELPKIPSSCPARPQTSNASCWADSLSAESKKSMNEKSMQELKQKVHDKAIRFGPISSYDISCVDLLWLIREAAQQPPPCDNHSDRGALGENVSQPTPGG